LAEIQPGLDAAMGLRRLGRRAPDHLLTGILSKLNEAGWAIVSVIVLCWLLAGLHRRPR
jgi:hypothetical protein